MTGEQYRIRYISDDYLPPGKLWAMCRRGAHTVLYIAASVREGSTERAEAVLESAWAGYRELEAIPSRRLPDCEVLFVEVG